MTSLRIILSAIISLGLIFPPQLVWAKKSATSRPTKTTHAKKSEARIPSTDENATDPMKLAVRKISPATKKANDAREFRKAMAVIKYNCDALFLLMMTGASREAVKAIAADFKAAKVDLTKSIKLTINKEQIYFNDEATKIFVKTYSPLALKVGKRIWSYDPDRSADQNYMALKSMASGQSSNAMMRLLFPEARAQFGWLGQGTGIGLGAILGLATAQFAGFNKWWAGGFTAMSILAGNFLGKWNQNRITASSGRGSSGYSGGGSADSDGSEEAIQTMEAVRSQIRVDCEAGLVTIVGTGADVITVATSADGSQVVTEEITGGGTRKCTTATCERWPTLMERAKNCTNSADAGQLKLEILDAIPVDAAIIQNAKSSGGVD